MTHVLTALPEAEGLTPPELFADGADLWLVGVDDQRGAPALARVNADGVVALPPMPQGSVRSAIVHDDQNVL